MMEFFMAMIPPTVTHQEKKIRVVNGKPIVYEPDELKAARSKLLAHLSGHKPPERIHGPIKLNVWWCFPADDKHPSNTWRITKPDTDNLQKLLKDCMTETGFWEDDAQVCMESVQKIWNDVPGIYISLMQLQESKEKHEKQS